MQDSWTIYLHYLGGCCFIDVDNYFRPPQHMDAFDWINQLSENQTVGYADRY